MKLKEEHDALKAAYELLQEEHQKLQKQHAEDNGECSSAMTSIWCCAVLVINFFRLADAAKKAFNAKLKENDDFVQKMKELEQTERRAKERKALEK